MECFQGYAYLHGTSQKREIVNSTLDKNNWNILTDKAKKDSRKIRCQPFSHVKSIPDKMFSSKNYDFTKLKTVYTAINSATEI